MAMIAITTSNSIRVNPGREFEDLGVFISAEGVRLDLAIAVLRKKGFLFARMNDRPVAAFDFQNIPIRHLNFDRFY